MKKMWLIDVCGGYAAIVGLGVQCRWETGLGSGLGLGVGVRKRSGIQTIGKIWTTQMNNVDSFVVDTSPIVDKFLTNYDKYFTGLIE